MNYGIGLDIGIASVGFAVMELDREDMPCRIIKMGTRIFEAAENPKDGASLALPRREARSARRRTRRRKHRKERIRSLFISQNMLSSEELDNLYNGNIADIYQLRVDALDRLLTNSELARVLIHLSQRRGFSSNRRAEKDTKEAGLLLKAVEQNKTAMSEKQYRTVGEMLCKDERYAENKRNKTENYMNTVSREMILEEARMIFECQHNYGNNLCNADFKEKYCEILLSQRSFDEGPGGNSPYGGDQIGKMVGDCTFEKDEKRAAKASYSFELFDLLQKINHIRLEFDGKSRALFEDERRKIIDKAHNSPSKMTAVSLRKLLGLPEDVGVNFKDYTPLKAYHEMRKAFDKINKDRIKAISIETRNEIGRIFTIFKSEDKIKLALQETDLSQYDMDSLVENLGSFSKFGHLSLKALNKIIPHLEQGFTYDKACKEAGYDHKGHSSGNKSALISLQHLAEETENTITSPVARRALSQCAKVINAVIRDMDRTSPVYINIELAREMSNDFDERMKLDKSMKENNARNERLKERIYTEYGKTNPTGLDIVKLKLYEEQSGICPYSLKQMDISQLFDPGYSDIDHIVPYSVSFDDSYKNKVLVRADENRQKGNRLPMQYLKGKKRDNFIVWVNCNVRSAAKKRLLLKEELTDEDLKGFKERNLHDTKTISRFMYNYLSDYLAFSPFTTERKRHVTAVNGAVTSMLRKRWGLNKVREDGDLHHALDAAVVACTTQGMINYLTRFNKSRENFYCEESGFEISKKTGEVLREKFPQPYKHFSDEAQARLSPTPKSAVERFGIYSPTELEQVKPIFVSRMPNRKISGAAHKETIKGIGENNSQIKKVPLTSLKLDKNGEIDGYYNPNDDRLLYNALKSRLAEYDGKGEKAFEEPFYKPKSDGTPGHLVKKVKIEEKSTLNVLVHDKTGSADNGGMVRVDVFYVEGDGYYLVPIYVADIVKGILPNKAIVAYKTHSEWKEMKDDDFMFSMYPNDLIYVEHKKNLTFSKVNKESKLPTTIERKGEYVYYKGTNISTGAMTIINHDKSYIIGGIGAKTLLKFEKWQVDVLGNISKVSYEQRLGFKNQKEG
ncbi:MAG: type II CRISPR RNA-guided endonuclease Cas9 [Oscillospiraceae bacterium]|nr:type II CRISPR RNA-guided endonuclease Cas9 [Oscillospiraceae bacterium]